MNNALTSATVQASDTPRSLGWSASFTFPFKTVTGGNQRRHHFGRAKAVKKEREAIYFAWFASGKPQPPRWPCRVTFTRIGPRFLDRGDNLNSSFKGMRDELAKILGLRNDAGPEVVWEYDQIKTRDMPASAGLTPGQYYVRVDLHVAGRCT
jgi:hypothetical protein